MPTKDINKMKRERQEKIEQVRSILDSAEKREEKRTSPEEESKISDLMSEIDRRSSDIEREEKLQALELRDASFKDEPDDFDTRSFGEFVQEVRFNSNSSALNQRSLTMSDGPSAGFLVPEQHNNTIREVTPQQAIIRPRAMVIPAGSPPDSAINLISLDQSGALGVYSGVVVRWLAENAQRQDAGDPSFRNIKLEPQEVSGYINVSDKLLRNSAAVGPYVQKLLRGAIIGSEDFVCYRGDGVGKPMGIIGHPSAITIDRAAGNAVVYADIVNMMARNMGDNPVFIASRTVLPQLMTMTDPGGNLIWQRSAREGEPSTLLGYPLLINKRSPVLGSEGDLSLVDLDYYAIKDGSSLAIAIDPYTQKINGLTRIYAIWNVDGQPMMTTPILEEDGVTTSSPFVVLR